NSGRLILAGNNADSLLGQFNQSASALGPVGTAHLIINSFMGAIATSKTMRRLLHIFETIDASPFGIDVFANCLLNAIITMDTHSMGKQTGFVLVWALHHSGLETLDSRAADIVAILCQLLHSYGNAKLSIASIPKVQISC